MRLFSKHNVFTKFPGLYSGVGFGTFVSFFFIKTMQYDKFKRAMLVDACIHSIYIIHNVIIQLFYVLYLI